MSGLEPAAKPYLRTPALSSDGQQIAFVYSGNIWIVGLAGGNAERFTAYSALHGSPLWTPDNRAIAFSTNRRGNGEIYLQPLDGSNAVQLTVHSMVSTPESWTPDGKHLLISSNREMMGQALYRVPLAGGDPVAWLAQPYADLQRAAISPDGTRLAVNLVRSVWWRRGPNPYAGSEIWVASNTPNPTDFQRIGASYIGLNSWPMWAPDGESLLFVSDRDGADNIWQINLQDGEARQITRFTDGRVLWPSISGDAQTIVFERAMGLWRLDVASGEAEPLSIRVRAEPKTAPMRLANVTRELSELALSPDAKKVAFVAHGTVFVDFADKETDKERRQGPSFRVTNTPFREADVIWAPDSRSLVYTSDREGDEELYRYDVLSHIETQLTSGGGLRQSPLFSPDGKWLAYGYASDEIRLMDMATNTERPFVRANFVRGATFAWSPDSRWLVFSGQDDRAFANLYVQAIDSEEPRQISFLSNVSTTWPLWSPDGNFIISTTHQYRDEQQIVRIDLQHLPPQFREDEFEKLFEVKDDTRKKTEAAPTAPAEPPAEGQSAPPAEPKPEEKKDSAPAAKQVTIVFEGIDRRIRMLTSPQLDASALAISPDSRDLIFRAYVAGKGNLWTMPLDDARSEQAPRQLTSSNGFKGAVQFTPEGKSFYYVDNSQVYIRKFPGSDTTPLALNAEMTIDFNKEKLQIFDEAWRILRDRFYDPGFRGLDWAEIRSQYRPYAVGAQSYNDLHTVLRLMIGELRASHTGVASYAVAVDDGYLGIVFDARAQLESGRFVAGQIMRESPAALAGVTVGDELLAVDGVAPGPENPLDLLLQRTIGRRVRLRMANREGQTRELALRPISNGAYWNLQYRNWVEDNERYVHRISGGRLGYVHIHEMSYAAYQRLLIDLDAEMHSREGIVVDIRFNGGGHIFSFILDVLSRRTLLLHGFRDLPATDSAHFHGNRVLNKPTVLVINEETASNAELFVEGYRRMGLGVVVGRPTAGAVISTHQRTLLDGIGFRVPQYRVTTIEGEDLEGTGRPADVDVALPLGATAATSDPQLDAAVASLLQTIEDDKGESR